MKSFNKPQNTLQVKQAALHQSQSQPSKPTQKLKLQKQQHICKGTNVILSKEYQTEE
ncbi:hypothetical protein Hanom_Chr02g00177741 [Helianthus anomalus]